MPYIVYSDLCGRLDVLARLEDAKIVADGVVLRNPKDRAFAVKDETVVYRAISKEQFEITG